MLMRDLRRIVEEHQALTDDCQVRFAQVERHGTFNYAIHDDGVYTLDEKGEGFLYLVSAGQVYNAPYADEKVSDRIERYLNNGG